MRRLLLLSLFLLPLLAQAQPVVRVDGQTLTLAEGATERRFPFDGTFVAARTEATGAHVGVLTREGDSIRLRVLDANGTEALRRVLPFRTDDPFPEFAVRPGRPGLAWVQPGTTDLAVMDESGQVHELGSLFPDATFALERATAIAYAPDGAAFAVAAMKAPTRPDPAAENVVLFLFYADGTLRWQRALPYQSLHALEFGGHGLSVSTYDAYAPEGLRQETSTFDLGGTLQARTETLIETSPHPLFHMPATAPARPLATTESGFPWPVPPFDETHPITGAFAEYRGPSNPHFHNGTDIPKPDGSPVYPVKDGKVTAILTTGSNAYVRVDSFAYVHIIPNSSLRIGDTVKRHETVLGTIYPGQGHVHLILGYNGSSTFPERNAILPGHLTPFTDTWNPLIQSVRFAYQPTGQTMQPDQLSGEVQISFQVRERTGSPTQTQAAQNNGAYRVGYQVLTRDRQTVVYEPTPGGVVFQFDTKPSDNYVHNVYDGSRSDNGTHVYVVTNQLTQPSYLDVNELGEGDYTIKLFAEDTRENRAEHFVDVSVVLTDVVPPPQPTLLYATFFDGQPRFNWTSSSVPDLDHFRLYPSSDGVSFEERIEVEKGTVLLDVEAFSGPRYFQLTAADTVASPNESTPSDVYGLAADPQARRLLIVDGFDRIGSWRQPRHDFAAVHGRALAAHGFGFETAANEALTSGKVNPLQYETIFWILGDESTDDQTFSSAEQQRVRAFLHGGGRLFVSGSEIAWDLGAQGSTSDQTFLKEWLKVDFHKDNAISYTVTGEPGTPFEGLTFTYGSVPYIEDYPDTFTPVEGGAPAFRYASGDVAGVFYSGTYLTSTKEAKLVILGFPFETIEADMQAAVMARVLAFFYAEDTATEHDLPRTLTLFPIAPNPVRASATIRFMLPEPRTVHLDVWDVLGRRVSGWEAEPMAAGTHTREWNGQHLAPGLYIVRLRTGDDVRTQKLLLVR